MALRGDCALRSSRRTAAKKFVQIQTVTIMQPIFIDKISRLCLVAFSLVMAFATFACFYFSLSQLNGIGFALPVPSAIAGILAVTVLFVVATFRNRIAAIFREIEHLPHL